MIFPIVFAALTAVSGFYPPFQPPTDGIGSETAGGGVRAFSMGGVSAGVPDSAAVSIVNPAASAWAVNTGLAVGTKFRDTADPDWSEAASFPDISLMMPLPYGLQLAGVLSGRSRLNSEDEVSFNNLSGTVEWTGSTAESYLGLTMQASRNLAFSIGGKCFFGSAMGDAVTSTGGGSGAPITGIYRDDLSFGSSWGLSFGAFMNSGPVAAGLSIATDRSGELSIQRDYMGGQEADTTESYSVPGELAAGVSVRVHPRILLAADYYARKALTLFDHTTEEGSYIACGVEVQPGYGFRVRSGYRSMSGLWRDGASRYSGGLGYVLSNGAASIDAGASWESWDDQSETVYFIGIRASENWLGQ